MVFVEYFTRRELSVWGRKFTLIGNHFHTLYAERMLPAGCWGCWRWRLCGAGDCQACPPWGDPVHPLAVTYYTLWREISTSSSYLRSREWGSTSLRVEYLHKLLRIYLYEEICFFLFIVNLFSYLFILIYTHGYLFYALDYNPVLLHSSYFSNCSHFGYWELCLCSCVFLT